MIEAMTEMNAICPAHNPPYIAAMQQLRERLPQMPLVAAFETGFHATIPERLRRYAVPSEWADEFQLRPLGLSRREPSVRRRSDARADRQRATCG